MPHLRSIVPALVACALLLAVCASSARAEILYDQYDSGVSGPGSQYLLSSHISTNGAPWKVWLGTDDFVVPAQHRWTVDEVEVDGYFDATDPGRPFPLLVVSFYEDSTLGEFPPPAPFYATSVAAGEYSISGDGDLVLPIEPLALTEGRYWLSVHAMITQSYSCAECGPVDSQRRWRWRQRTVGANQPGRYRADDDSACQHRWCALADGAGNPQDLVFRLRGTDPYGDAKEPQVAVAPDGRAVFAWLEWDGSNWIVRARARSAGGALSGVQTISGRGRDASHPRLAIEDDGDAVFTWRRWNGTNEIVQSRARAASGVLSGVQSLSSPGQDAAEPKVDVGAGGDAVFGWLRWDGANWIAQTRTRRGSGELSAVDNLSSPGGHAFRLDLAVDPAGNATFVWQRAGIIQTKRRAVDETLSAVQNLAGPGASAPDVGVDDAGRAIFSWVRPHSSGDTLLWSRRRDLTGTLTPTQAVSPVGATVDPSAEVAVEGDGDAIYAWESIADEDVFIRIKARRRAADGSFSAVSAIDAVPSSRGPHVAVDALGGAVFTWVGRNAEDASVVRTRRRSQEGALSPAQSLALVVRGSDPRAGVDGVGNALFAWERQSDTRAWIQGRHRAEGGFLSPLFALTG